MFKITCSILLTLCIAFAAVSAHPAPQTDFRIANIEASGWAALPLLGFVLDAPALRPLIGIAGAAAVGAPLKLGFDISRAEIPPGHDYMLATTGENDWPLWIQVRAGTMRIRPMDSFINRRGARVVECFESDTPDGLWERRSRRCVQERPLDESAKITRIALSSSGSAAALLSESTGRVYAFNNMADSPALVGRFESGRLGPVSALGISDDGRTAALGISDGVSGALFVLTAGREPRLIASMGHPSAIRFLRNRDGAIIADSAENRVYALTGGQIFSIAAAEDGIAAPLGIAVSNDNQRVFVGNSESGSVVTIRLDGSGSTPTYCNCALTGLQPTNTDSVFRLTDFSGAPILLFDGNSAVPRITFVPVNSEF